MEKKEATWFIPWDLPKGSGIGSIGVSGNRGEGRIKNHKTAWKYVKKLLEAQIPLPRTQLLSFPAPQKRLVDYSRELKIKGLWSDEDQI